MDQQVGVRFTEEMLTRLDRAVSEEQLALPGQRFTRSDYVRRVLAQHFAQLDKQQVDKPRGEGLDRAA